MTCGKHTQPYHLLNKRMFLSGMNVRSGQHGPKLPVSLFGGTDLGRLIEPATTYHHLPTLAATQLPVRLVPASGATQTPRRDHNTIKA